jgi:hypothetical protein
MAPGGGIFGFVALDAGDYAQGSSHGEDKYRTFSDGYERLRAAFATDALVCEPPP